ncbi:MAG TPA: hypothetical protein VE032_10750 [Actinomycetota bacterium]|nr:hypothetical protein [Actinomycetota bacterium]
MSSTVRRTARIALALSLAVLLAGCLKAKQDLTLHPDDTVDGVVLVAVSEELIELSGSTAEEVLQQITEGESPIPEGIDAEIEDYQEDGFVGKTFTFTGAPISAINDQGDLSITHEGDTFVVDGDVDLSAGETPIDPTDPATQELMSEFDVSLSVTFPGEVSDHDGSLDGTTVTWTPAFGEATSIHAVGSAIDEGSSSLLWILIALGVIVLIAVVVIVVLRGRGTTAPDEAGTPAEGAPAVSGDVPAMPGTPEAATTAPAVESAAPEPVTPEPEPEPMTPEPTVPEPVPPTPDDDPPAGETTDRDGA